MHRMLHARLAAAVLVLIALSGCGRVTTDITVHDDGTYDLTLVMAGSEAELATAGQTPESFTTLLTEELSAQPGVEGFVITDYRQDGYAGVEITGETVPGDDVGIFGRRVISTDAEGIHLDLQYPLTIVTGSFTPEQTAAVEVRTTVTFPSEVIEHNGTLLDDVTVQWSGDGSTDLDYTASSAPTGTASVQTTDASDAQGTWAAPLALALGVAAAAGVGVWVVLRARPKDDPGGLGGPGSDAATTP